MRRETHAAEAAMPVELALVERERPIGIFDSGIGGLTVVRQVHQALPNEDLVYLGDTARVPYGTKSPSTVIRFACEDTAFLREQLVKAVVVACNTASAWALPTLEREFGMPIFGVIIPGAEAALAATRTGRIGVIGTNATIRSQAYPRAIQAKHEGARVFARACPLLVPLVEEGWVDHLVTDAVLREYLAPLLEEKIDTLVLGCTHYPLLKPALQRLVGSGISLVDSAESCAAYVRQRLEDLRLLKIKTNRSRPGKIHPFVTDEIEKFEEMAARFLGVPSEAPRRAELPPYALASSGWNE
jgi:glutamate racemase